MFNYLISWSDLSFGMLIFVKIQLFMSSLSAIEFRVKMQSKRLVQNM